MNGTGYMPSARGRHGLRHGRKSFDGNANTGGMGIFSLSIKRSRDMYIGVGAKKARIYNARRALRAIRACHACMKGVVAHPCHPCTRAALPKGGAA